MGVVGELLLLVQGLPFLSFDIVFLDLGGCDL